jgi:serine/threonine-protein kinase
VPSHHSGDTILTTHLARQPSGFDSTPGLSTQIQHESLRRLRILALVYGLTFFMASFVPDLLLPDLRARLPQEWANSVPDAIAIAMALVMAWLTRSRRLSPTAIMNAGLVFLVVGNYFIAIAEYIDPERLDNGGWMGLSWVAVWTLLFTVAVPTQPRKAMLATLASVSAPPAVIGFMMVTERTVLQASAGEFFVGIVFPYVIVTMLAYIGQSVVYALGRQATQAQELGSYHLVERIGQGGMGEVWRAEHRLLVRPAAIKVIKGSLAGEAAVEAMQRFEREAQVTAQLRSPHTVELWDFGTTDDGGFYYVMELLDGIDLDKLVTGFGPVPPERTIFLLHQICHSLTEAHAHGLVHRDIKPGNIFACRYGSDHDFVKVLDFGIVKATHVDKMETGSLETRANVVRGTPAFIAPEQALGGSVDGRADIYAVGCVAYWLLTGQLVFKADTPMGVLMHHAQTPPPRPSSRSELLIPAALDDLVIACLAKDPGQRPQTAGELSRRLGEIACEVWTEERARAWWAAHRPAQ